MALNITENQPLTPLDPFFCCEAEADYCHLIDTEDLLYLQATQSCCDTLECTEPSFTLEPLENSTFDIDETGWTPDAGWTWSSGEMCIEAGATGAQVSTPIPNYVAGQLYKVVFTVTITTGCIKVSVGGGDFSEEITTSGTYTLILTGGALDDLLLFETCAAENTMCLDDVYVYTSDCDITLGANWTMTEVSETVTTPDPGLINGDFFGSHGWNAGYKWTVGSGVASVANVAGSAGNSLTQQVNISANERYYLEFQIANYSVGEVDVFLGGLSIDTVSANGVFTYTTAELVSINNQLLEFRGKNGATMDIEYVILTGVADWTRILYYNFCHTEGAVEPVTFTDILPLDTLLKVEVTVSGSTAGTLTVTAGSSSSTLSGNGTFVRYLNSGTSDDLVFTPSTDFDGCFNRISICTLTNDYRAVVKDSEGNEIIDISDMLIYTNEYVTLEMDVTDLCLWKTCFTNFDNTVISSVNVLGVPIPISPTVSIDNIPGVLAALNGLNIGTWTYELVGSEYCVTVSNKDVDSIVITIIDADDSYPFACERISLDGCYTICIFDPCPEETQFEAVVDIAFDSEAEATDEGWLWGSPNSTFSGGLFCTPAGEGESSGIIYADYQNGTKYRITIVATSVDSTGIDVQIFGETQPEILYPGTYVYEVTGALGDDTIILGTTEENCIDSFLLEVETPLEICTPCFKVGDFDCTKLLTSTDSGEQMGFNFDTGFKLQQRVDVERFNPFYPDSKTDYKYSDGTRKNVYVETESFYLLRTGAVPANVHATLRAQVSLRDFLIDEVRYFVPEQDIRPEWGDVPNTLAEVQINVRKEEGTKYKRQ